MRKNRLRRCPNGTEGLNWRRGTRVPAPRPRRAVSSGGRARRGRSRTGPGPEAGPAVDPAHAEALDLRDGVMLYLDPRRPAPDSLMPPTGAIPFGTIPSRTSTIPYSDPHGPAGCGRCRGCRNTRRGRPRRCWPCGSPRPRRRSGTAAPPARTSPCAPRPTRPCRRSRSARARTSHAACAARRRGAVRATLKALRQRSCAALR